MKVKRCIDRCETIGDLRKQFDSIKSTTAGDVRFIASSLMFIAEKISKEAPRNISTKPVRVNSKKKVKKAAKDSPTVDKLKQGVVNEQPTNSANVVQGSNN